MEHLKMVDQLIQRSLRKRPLLVSSEWDMLALPLVLRFCEEDFNVLGFDVDSKKGSYAKGWEKLFKIYIALQDFPIFPEVTISM